MITNIFFSEINRDSSFATGANRGVYDDTADKKIRKAVMDNVVNFVHNYDHLCWYCCFIMMRYFGLRGGNEVTQVRWDQVSFKKYTDGQFKGKNYVELLIKYDKGKLLSFYVFNLLFCN